jgi:hypothetical protein
MNLPPSDAEQLRRKANAGDIAAMAALGRSLISASTASPSDLEEARRLLIPSADAGNGEAAFLVSRLTGIDASLENSWARALTYLTRSAAQGYLISQIELAFLAGQPGVVKAVAKGEILPSGIWQSLHEAIDPGIWTAKAPRPRFISTAPPIAVAENFASPDICDWLIHAARSKLGPSTSYDRSSGRSVASHKVATPELDLVVMSLVHRIAAMTGVPINGQEGASVLRYQPGEKFEPHYDFLDPRQTPELAADILKSGQRVITFLLYLSEDFEGGETYFPKIGRGYKGRKGDALFFRNVDDAGNPDYTALHAGLAPTRGEKWVFVRVCTRIPVNPGTA